MVLRSCLGACASEWEGLSNTLGFSMTPIHESKRGIRLPPFFIDMHMEFSVVSEKCEQVGKGLFVKKIIIFPTNSDN